MRNGADKGHKRGGLAVVPKKRYLLSMSRLAKMKVSVMVTAVLLNLTLSGCGKSQYDTCMESYQRLAGQAAQALLNGDEALSRSYEQEMLNTQATCNLFR